MFDLSMSALELGSRLDGGSTTPTDAARKWVKAGAPAAAEPMRGILDAAQRGPASVDLTLDELSALTGLLGSSYSTQATDPASDQLLARGVLIRSTHGLALAPAYLWTLGVASWANRSVGFSASPADPQSTGATHAVEFYVIGDRAVECRSSVDGTTRCAVIERPAVTQAARAFVAAPSLLAASRLHARFSWTPSAADVHARRPTNETVTAEIDAGGVRWSSVLDGVPAPTERLSHDDAAERLQVAVGRGSGQDRRLADESLMEARLARGGSNPVSRMMAGNAVTGVALDDYVWPGLGDKRQATYEARIDEAARAEYWRKPPSFISKRR